MGSSSPGRDEHTKIFELPPPRQRWFCGCVVYVITYHSSCLWRHWNSWLQGRRRCYFWWPALRLSTKRDTNRYNLLFTSSQAPFKFVINLSLISENLAVQKALQLKQKPFWKGLKLWSCLEHSTYTNNFKYATAFFFSLSESESMTINASDMACGTATMKKRVGKSMW